MDMSLLNWITVKMFKMQFVIWMVNIIRGLSFLIILEVLMTVVVVIVIMVAVVLN